MFVTPALIIFETEKSISLYLHANGIAATVRSPVSLDKVLSLNLIKKEEEIDGELLKYINESIEKRSKAMAKEFYNNIWKV